MGVGPDHTVNCPGYRRQQLAHYFDTISGNFKDSAGLLKPSCRNVSNASKDLKTTDSGIKVTGHRLTDTGEFGLNLDLDGKFFTAFEAGEQFHRDLCISSKR